MRNLLYITSGLLLSLTTMQAQDRTMPKPGPAPTVNVGKPQKFTLPNGMKVMVVENHKLPRVSFNLSIDNVPFTEGNKKGIDDLTSALMGNGTSKISKDAYNEEIDFMGASIDLNSQGAFATGLSKYAGRVLELMAQGLLDPNFTQEELDKEKAKLIEGLKSNEKSVPSVAGRVENVLAFGKNHPSGEYLTETTINNVSLTDVKNHYSTYFVPENAYLVVIGDVKLADVKAKVEQVFEDWTKAKAPNLSFVEPKNVQYTQINFVDMPNAVQSNISFVNTVNLKMTDKDFFPTLIANQIFGGDFNSYLNMNLREKHGWTYGASSSIRGSKYVTKFKASSQVRNTVTDSAIVELLNELKRIRLEKVSDKVLQDVKNAYIGNFVMQVEKPETVARYALQTETQKLPADFYENYIKNINAVTAEQVMEAAKKFFLIDNARIVVVGKGTDVLPALEKTKIPMFFFDKFGNPVAKPEIKKADAKVTVQSIVDNYINAIGGVKAVSEVKTVFSTATGSIQGQTLEYKSKVSTKGNMSIDMSLPAMGMTVMKQRINDKTAYMEQQGQKKVFEGEDYKQMKAFAHPFFEMYFIDNATVSFSGIEKFNEADAYVIKTPNSKVYYDTKTGLRIGMEREQKVGDQVRKSTISYSDYKEVQGVKYPHQLNIEAGPMPLEFKVTEMKINEGVSELDFQ